MTTMDTTPYVQNLSGMTTVPVSTIDVEENTDTTTYVQTMPTMTTATVSTTEVEEKTDITPYVQNMPATTIVTVSTTEVEENTVIAPLDPLDVTFLLRVENDLKQELQDEFDALSIQMARIETETVEEKDIRTRLLQLKHALETPSSCCGPLTSLWTLVSTTENNLDILGDKMVETGEELLELVRQNTELTKTISTLQSENVEATNRVYQRYTATKGKATKLGTYYLELKAKMERIHRWGPNMDSTTTKLLSELVGV